MTVRSESEPDDWLYKWVDELSYDSRTNPITHYPSWQSALSRINNGYDRFEVYFKGIELGNAFHEELNASELLFRWEKK